MSIICDLKCVAFQFFRTIFLKHVKVSVEFSIEALAICLLLNAAFVKIRFYNTIQFYLYSTFKTTDIDQSA